MTERRMVGGKTIKVNTEALAGVKCPSCGHMDSFWISTDCDALWTDDGPKEYNDASFSPRDTYCTCHKCGFNADIEDFCIEKT